MAGAELLPALMISRWVNLPLTTLRTVPRQLEHHHLDVSAHQPAHSPNPKTFQIRTIAALPEPAGRPTHGLLSRRSTDRISTSPLANFAQLSMFRFDGLTILAVLIYSNTASINKSLINTKSMNLM